MIKLFLTLFILNLFLYGKYYSNKSCSECHSNIYDEYKQSYHSKTYFNDELHRKVADNVEKLEHYNCSTCHMPSAKDQIGLAKGTVKPNPHEIRDTDAISCFFCHQIATVKKAHIKNKIILARQIEGYKPTIFGSLKNPLDSDKHSMTHSPIYDKFACSGCHSHKRNSYGTLIFDAMGDNIDSHDCIKCHMPLVKGKLEDMNRGNRTKHHSHKFLGIHDKDFRQKGIDLNISIKNKKLLVTLTNKTPHPLIIQVARIKYLVITIKRNGKVIWKNYSKNPIANKKDVFKIEFLDKNDKPVIIPAYAYKRGFVNNLKGKESKLLKYNIPTLKKGDIITAKMFVYLAKPSCLTKLKIKNSKLQKPYLLKEKTIIVK